jgi:hypothetical protein
MKWFSIFRWFVFAMIFFCTAVAVIDEILGKYVWMVIMIGCVGINTLHFIWLTYIKDTLYEDRKY